MIPRAELAADFDLAQGPAAEGPDRADRDELPEPSFGKRGDAEADLELRRLDRD